MIIDIVATQARNNSIAWRAKAMSASEPSLTLAPLTSCAPGIVAEIGLYRRLVVAINQGSMCIVGNG